MTKWFVTIPAKEKAKIVKDATQLVLARRVKMCNFLEYKGKRSTSITDIELTIPVYIGIRPEDRVSPASVRIDLDKAYC